MRFLVWWRRWAAKRRGRQKNGREKTRKTSHRVPLALEQLETRCLPSTTYTLSLTGDLSRVVDNQATVIAQHVTSFAVDNAGDVFAAFTKGGQLQENPAGSSSWNTILYSDVDRVDINAANDELVVTMASEVYVTPAASPGLLTQVGAHDVTAPDGSLWYVGTSDSAIYRLQSGQLSQVPPPQDPYAFCLGVLEGSVVALTSTDQISFWDGSAWHNALEAIDGPNGQIYFLGTANADSHGN